MNSCRHIELLQFPSQQALVAHAAQRLVDAIRSVEDRPRPFGLALSGGRIAGRFFDAVAAMGAANRVSFQHVEFFWADERRVPPGDPESNFALAREHLLAPLSVAGGRIHRLRGEADPALAAREASAEALRILPADAGGSPVLDVVLLGMGEDGHVASLFPGAPESVVSSREAYVPVIGPKPPPQRITMSYCTLAAAREVWVLVSGPGKEEALRESLSDTGSTPLARVARSRAMSLVLTDLPRERR